MLKWNEDDILMFRILVTVGIERHDKKKEKYKWNMKHSFRIRFIHVYRMKPRALSLSFMVWNEYSTYSMHTTSVCLFRLHTQLPEPEALWDVCLSQLPLLLVLLLHMHILTYIHRFGHVTLKNKRIQMENMDLSVTMTTVIKSSSSMDLSKIRKIDDAFFNGKTTCVELKILE